jgi:hypothetical protein
MNLHQSGTNRALISQRVAAKRGTLFSRLSSTRLALGSSRNRTNQTESKFGRSQTISAPANDQGVYCRQPKGFVQPRPKTGRFRAFYRYFCRHRTNQPQSKSGKGSWKAIFPVL